MKKKCFLSLVLLLTAQLFALDLEYKVVRESAKCEIEVIKADLSLQFANKNIKSFKVRAGEKIKYDSLWRLKLKNRAGSSIRSTG